MINIANNELEQAYVGSTPVDSIYLGEQKVWPEEKENAELTITFIHSDTYPEVWCEYGSPTQVEENCTNLTMNSFTNTDDSMHFYLYISGALSGATTVVEVESNALNGMQGDWEFELGTRVTVTSSAISDGVFIGTTGASLDSLDPFSGAWSTCLGRASRTLIDANGNERTLYIYLYASAVA